MKNTVLIFLFVVIGLGLNVAVSGQPRLGTQDFEKGIELARAGNFDSALVEFRVSLARNVKASDEFRSAVYYNIGVCQYRLADQGAAIEALSAAVSLRPAYEKAYYALGMAAAESGDFRLAEGAFTKAADLNPRNAEVWFDLAYVYLARQNIDAAKRTFNISIELGSLDTAAAHNNVGVIAASFGDLSEAEKSIETAIRISGDRLEIARQNLRIIRQMRAAAGKQIAARITLIKPFRSIGD